MLNGEDDLSGLCQVCDVPHENTSPGECRLAAERRRLGAELDDVITNLPTGASTRQRKRKAPCG